MNILTVNLLFRTLVFRVAAKICVLPSLENGLLRSEARLLTF